MLTDVLQVIQHCIQVCNSHCLKHAYYYNHTKRCEHTCTSWNFLILLTFFLSNLWIEASSLSTLIGGLMWGGMLVGTCCNMCWEGENSEKITAIASMNFLMLGKLLSMSVFRGDMCSSSNWNVVKFATLCSVFAINISVLVACGGGCSAMH